MNGPMRRVIVVDDHPIVRRGVKCLIEANGRYSVVGEAADGHAAMELAAEAKPDLAIADFSLPHLDGLSLARFLKREMPKVGILIYTMHDRDEVIIEVLRAGVRAFVLKSDPDSNVVAALDALSVNRPYFSDAISEHLLGRFLDTQPPVAAPTLSPRERNVVQLVAEGQSNKEIAKTLGVSTKTVETHRSNAMQKLELKTTADLVRYAVRNYLTTA